MSDENYTYIRETKYTTLDEAIIAAFRDIEHDRAEPIEIVRENGDLVHDSEVIYNKFYLSNHEPIDPEPEPAPPTIRARVVNKQDEIRRIGWLTRMKSKLNDALSGKPGYWQ